MRCTRRGCIAGLCGLALCACRDYKAELLRVPNVIAVRAAGQAFDYYMSPTGVDTNTGSLSSPWSLSAFNTKQSTYAGKRVGLIGGTYQYVNSGSGPVSIYSLIMANSVNQLFNTQGGPTGSQPTYIASCGTNGLYSPRTATIDCSDPITNALPTVEVGLLGQNDSQVGGVTQYDNITFDGICVRYWTAHALSVRAIGQTITNSVFQNCEIYNSVGQVGANNNPGGIHLAAGAGLFTVTNCKFHDITSASPLPITLTAAPSGTITSVTMTQNWPYSTATASNALVLSTGQAITATFTYGSPTVTFTSTAITAGATTSASAVVGTFYPYATPGIILIDNDGGPYVAFSNCSFYNCPSISFKNTMLVKGRVSYCYLDSSSFGNTNGTDSESLHVFICADPAGTLQVDHCIILGFVNTNQGSIAPLYNKGSIVVKNNTFYSPTGVSPSIAFAVDPTTPGNLTFQNNIIWNPVGYKTGSFTFFDVNNNGNGITGITGASVNYNYYGTGMQFQNGTGTSAALSVASWQALGYDLNSTIGGSPFSSTPAAVNIGSFAITGAALTAGVGGAACGALDGSGSVGCNF